MRVSVQPAIDHYNSLIQSNIESAEEQLTWFVEQQRERKLLFGDRPLTYSLRPAFLAESTYGHIQDTVYLLRQAILKIAEAYFNDLASLDELGLTDEEIELAAIPTNVIRLSATARLDAFLTPDSFKFVELNAESPAGVGYIHNLADLYRELPVFQDFSKQFPIRFVSPLEHLVAGLLRTYHEEFDGKVEKPTFCIVDFLDIPTIHEFHIVQDYLRRHGYECEVCDPRNLELRDGWIYANGKKIDILYRRLLMNEFMAIRGDCQAYEQGYRDQKTCYLNSFRTKLVHKKSIFSFLTDPKYTNILNTSELQTIRQHIPWTRKLRDTKTMYRGRMVGLLDHVYHNKASFVIKPNDEYGGKGVVLGFQAEDNEWAQAISYGLENGYVVQEVVDISKEPFLMKTDNGWNLIPTVVDLDPYLNGPMMGGCLVRTSSSNLANVTAGGGSMPAFILRYVR